MCCAAAHCAAGAVLTDPPLTDPLPSGPDPRSKIQDPRSRILGTDCLYWVELLLTSVIIITGDAEIQRTPAALVLVSLVVLAAIALVVLVRRRVVGSSREAHEHWWRYIEASVLGVLGTCPSSLWSQEMIRVDVWRFAFHSVLVDVLLGSGCVGDVR